MGSSSPLVVVALTAAMGCGESDETATGGSDAGGGAPAGGSGGAGGAGGEPAPGTCIGEDGDEVDLAFENPADDTCETIASRWFDIAGMLGCGADDFDTFEAAGLAEHADSCDCVPAPMAFSACLNGPTRDAWACDEAGRPTVGDPCAAQETALGDCVAEGRCASTQGEALHPRPKLRRGLGGALEQEGPSHVGRRGHPCARTVGAIASRTAPTGREGARRGRTDGIGVQVAGTWRRAASRSLARVPPSRAARRVSLARAFGRRSASAALGVAVAAGGAEARGRGPHDEANNVLAPPGVQVDTDDVRVRWRAYDDVAFERFTSVRNATASCQPVTLRVTPAADSAAFARAHVVTLDDARLVDIPFRPRDAEALPCGQAWRQHIGPPTMEEHLVLLVPPGASATVRRHTLHVGGAETGPDLPERDPRHTLLRRTYRPSAEGRTGQRLLLPQGLGRSEGEPLRIRVETPPGWRVEVLADVAGETVAVPSGPGDAWYRPPARCVGLQARVRPETDDSPSGGPIVEVALADVRSDGFRGRVGWEFLTGRHTVLALGTEHGLDGRHGLSAEFALAPRRGPAFLNFAPDRLTLGLGLVGHLVPALAAGGRVRGGFGYGPLELGLRVDLFSSWAEFAPYLQVTM